MRTTAPSIPIVRSSRDRPGTSSVKVQVFSSCSTLSERWAPEKASLTKRSRLRSYERGTKRAVRIAGAKNMKKTPEQNDKDKNVCPLHCAAFQQDKCRMPPHLGIVMRLSRQ